MPDMPAFEKSSPALVERFEAVVGHAAGPDVTRRPMFGYPCAWVGGNMATGLFREQWWVRLPPERLAAAFDRGEASPLSVMPGRPMPAYAVMPEAVVADDAQVDRWVRDALEYTASLPPKQPKPPKSKRSRG